MNLETSPHRAETFKDTKLSASIPAKGDPMRILLAMLLAALLVGCSREDGKHPAASAPVRVATAETFERDVLGSSVPVLVDFGATWCGPCRQLEPTIEALAKDFQVRKIDVDNDGELARRFGIRTIPAVLIFNKGEVVARFGFTDEATLREAMRKFGGKS